MAPETPSQPAAPPVPRRWLEDRPVSGRGFQDSRRRRQQQALAVLACMLGLAGVTLGLLSWVKAVPRPYFVPLWITEYESPQVPVNAQAEPDREAIRQGGYFPRTPGAAYTSQERTLLGHELARLKDLQPTDSAVVYLCAFARPDARGEIALFPADVVPEDRQTWVPLRSVLAYLGACPARHKLLILDVLRPLADPTLGVLANDVAGRIAAELEAVPDPARQVLCACAPGQVALTSETLNRSVFGYYLEQGLDGWADGYSPRGECDGRVSVLELAAFLQARVDRWTRLHDGTRQTPVLLGPADDWELVAPPHAAPTPQGPWPDLGTYPAWLRDGWEVRQRWSADETYRLDPRLFRELEATLVRAQQRWLGGIAPERVQSDLQNALATLEKQRTAARAAVAPPLQPFLSREDGNPKLAAALQEMLAKIDTATIGLKNDKTEALREKIGTEFLDRAAKEPAADVGAVLFRAAAADLSPSPARVRLLAHLLEASQPQPLTVEGLFLRRLADLSEQFGPAGWHDALIHDALTTVQYAARAADHSASFPWTRRLLQEAAQTGHNAEVRLWNYGYASRAEAEQLFKRAVVRYETFLMQADRLRQARRQLDEAVVFLPAYLPYLEVDESMEQPWLAAVRAAGELQAALTPPAADALLTEEAVSQAAERGAQKAATLGDQLQELRWPLRPESLRRFREQCAGRNVSPVLRRQLQALCNLPFLAPDDRIALWAAVREAARRSAEEVGKLDQQDNSSGQRTPAAEDPALERAQWEARERGRAVRRARCSIALLRLAGLDPVSLAQAEKLLGELEQQVAAAGADPALLALGRSLGAAWSDRLPEQLRQSQDPLTRARLARALPPLAPDPFLGQGAADPGVQLRLAERTGLWTWLANHFLYEQREAQALAAPGYVTTFYEQAADAYRQVARPGPDRHLLLSGSTLPLVLSATNPTAVYPLEVALSPPPTWRPTVSLAILRPNDDWIEVTPARDLLLEKDFRGLQPPSWSVPLLVRLRAAAADSPNPPPRGFLVEATADGRSAHWRVGLAPLRAPDNLEILLSANPNEPTDPIGDLLLRPLNQPQPISLYVRNAANKDRKTTVDLKANGEAVPAADLKLDLTAGATRRVRFMPPAVAPAAAVTPAPAVKAPELLPPLAGPLQIDLRGADADAALLARRVVPVGIARPLEYLQVVHIEFDPGEAAAGRKNRLTVRPRARDLLGGPPCQVELVLPPERIPGFLGAQEGNFRGVLTAAGQEVTLFAEDIRLAEGADEQGYVYVNVDGYQRAMIFRTTFARRGGPTTPREDFDPAIRLRVARYVQPTAALPVTVEVDNPPPGARLELSLGQPQENGFAPEIVKSFPSARRRYLGFRPFSPDGALLFEASLGDWVPELDVSRILGDCVLRARVLDASGDTVCSAAVPLTVQQSSPREVRLLGVPRVARVGTSLNLQASGSDSFSGVRKVLFFVGKPLDGKLPPTAATVAGTAVNNNGTLWSATLPLPAEGKGPTDVSVQFTNGAGLSTFATGTVDLVEQLPVLPGRIRGTVWEGAIRQPGLKVTLRDDKDKDADRGTATTGTDGSFTFAQVMPGTYRLEVRKVSTERSARATVTVEAGKEATVRLELYR